MKTEKFIILNDVEKPCACLVCRMLPNKKIIYVNKALRKRFPRLRKSNGWASLKDYGFVFEDNKFILKNPSKVKYSDGATKSWQGKKEFTYKEVMKMRYVDYA